MKIKSFFVMGALFVLVFALFGCTNPLKGPGVLSQPAVSQKPVPSNKRSQSTSGTTPVSKHETHTNTTHSSTNGSAQHQQPRSSIMQNQTQKPHTALTIKDLLHRSMATECTATTSTGDIVLHQKIVVVPNKYIFISTYGTNKANGSLVLKNSTSEVDLQSKNEYILLPNSSGNAINCKSAPRLCRWIIHRMTNNELSQMESLSVGAASNPHCKKIVSPPPFNINLQETCTEQQLKTNILYCACEPLKSVNQTAYQECLESRQMSDNTTTAAEQNGLAIQQMKPTYNQSAFINNTKTMVLNITITNESVLKENNVTNAS